MTKTRNTDRKPDLSAALSMTEEKRAADANSDPDARPMTDEEWAKSPRVPRVKIIRRALGLSQDEFATRFQIPVGTVRDWEQGRKQPDAAARAYLRVIAREPDTVSKALSPIAAV